MLAAFHIVLLMLALWSVERTGQERQWGKAASSALIALWCMALLLSIYIMAKVA